MRWSLTFRVPGRPISWSLGGRGMRRYLSPRAREYQQRIAAEAWRALHAAGLSPIRDREVGVSVAALVVAARTPDVDKLARNVLDGISLYGLIVDHARLAERVAQTDGAHVDWSGLLAKPERGTGIIGDDAWCGSLCIARSKARTAPEAGITVTIYALEAP